MVNINTVFNRKLLSNVLKEVKQELIKRNIPVKDFLKHSWGYKYSGRKGRSGEFHINKNEWLLQGFYWYGNVESVTSAKCEGWLSFLEQLENGTITLKKAV